MDLLTSFIEQSTQPSLLIDIEHERLIANSFHCVDLFTINSGSNSGSANTSQISASKLYQNILNEAKQLISKGLTYFNYEVLKGEKIIIVMADVKEQYLVIHLQEKLIYSIPSNNLNNILDSLGAQVYCKDVNYRYIYANKKVGQLFGKNHKELIGTTDDGHFNENNMHTIHQEIDSIISGEQNMISKEETFFVNHLNEAKTFLSVKKPLYSKHNHIIGLFGISTDISTYKATEKKLNTILDNIPVYIYIRDLEHRFTYANKVALSLFKCSIEQLKGSTPTDLLGEINGKEFQRLDVELFDKQQKVEGIEEFFNGDESFYYWTVKAPLHDDQGKITGLIGMSTDITTQINLKKQFKKTNKELKKKIKEITKLQATLWEQATHDPLTQLFNRRYFKEYLQKELSKVQRNKKPLALLLLDADFFKKINDDLGHDTGDKVLIKLSEIMMNECRRSDIICRYGGEEFVILMPEANKEAAFDRAEKIRVVYEQEISRLLNEKNTISIGIAMWHDELTNIEGFVKAADQAMYQAKENGRNQVVVYKETLHKK